MRWNWSVYYLVTRLVFFCALAASIEKAVCEGTWHTQNRDNTSLVFVAVAVPGLGEVVGYVALWEAVNERLVEVSKARASLQEAQ